MSQFDRCVLSLLLLSGCLLALREGDYQARSRAIRPDIVVSVMGAVARPGVVRLPADGRAVHAIELCGGLALGADAESVELARPLHDGEHLLIARLPKAEPVRPAPDASPPPNPSTKEGGVNPTVKEPRSTERASQRREPGPKQRPQAVSQSLPAAGPIDINKASATELEGLPGVGPVMAQRIVEARQAAPGGTFGSLEELGAIRGIKAKTLRRLTPYLKIEGS